MRTVPTSFVAEHAPHLGQGGISQGTVEATLAGPTSATHAGSVECFDHDHPVFLGQGGAGRDQVN
ncbi:hypothetical protein EB74_13030 [Mycobacterium sp. SWH-M5]|nr:hypothetical protein EB74_13030 [Mycobacterium sp. SWH-M5]